MTTPTHCASSRRSQAASLLGSSPTTWRVVPAGSIARFTAATLWGRVPVSGRLGDLSGALAWDGARGRGRLVIDAGGLASGNGLRDHHLRSRAFFDAAKHRALVFDVDRIAVADGAVQLTGTLLLRGRAHKLTCAATATRHALDRLVLEGRATFDLDELGMSRGLFRMLPAAVTADVRVVMRRSGP
jgi:polyisoprenoid-binding protein YceI